MHVINDVGAMCVRCVLLDIFNWMFQWFRLIKIQNWNHECQNVWIHLINIVHTTFTCCNQGIRGSSDKIWFFNLVFFPSNHQIEFQFKNGWIWILIVFIDLAEFRSCCACNRPPSTTSRLFYNEKKINKIMEFPTKWNEIISMNFHQIK